MHDSPSLRLAQIVFGCIFCLVSAGVIFGFAALKPVLIQEGVYADLCIPGERIRGLDGQWTVCLDQDTRLNFMFTLATVVTNVVCLPVGYTLDSLGPRKTSILGGLVFAAGTFFFGLGFRSSYFDSYIFGFILLGIGGPLIFLPQFHLSNAFPAYSGVVLAAVTGSFDASSVPLVLYRMAYNAGGGSLSLRTFFWGYLIVPFCIIVEQLTIGPLETYQRLAANDTDSPGTVEAAPVANDSAVYESFSSFSRIHYGDAQDDDEGMIEAQGSKDSLTGALYGLSAKEQICSKWFVLLTLFVCIHMTRINFYVMSVASQLEYFTGDAVLADRLTVAFTVILPLGGFIGIPFIGFLLDCRPFFDVLCVLAAMGALFGTLGMSSRVWSQLVGIGVFCLFRPLMYTGVSDAFAKVFGFQTFGTVYGLAMTTSGLVGLVNAPLDLLVKSVLGGNFVPIGITFVAAGLISCASLMVVVWQHTKKGALRLE